MPAIDTVVKAGIRGVWLLRKVSSLVRQMPAPVLSSGYQSLQKPLLVH
jgi:hypothetical protein